MCGEIKVAPVFERKIGMDEHEHNELGYETPPKPMISNTSLGVIVVRI